MNLFNFYKNYSLKTHLIVGATIIHLVLMSILISDFYFNQYNFTKQIDTKNAFHLVQTISQSIRPWLISKDIAGLNEIISKQKKFSQIKYAFIIDSNNKVLAHTNEKNIGTFINDEKSLKSFSLTKENITYQDDYLIDLASPVYNNDQIIGWVRLGYDKSSSTNSIQGLLLEGLFLTILALILGWIFTNWLATNIVKQIENLKKVAMDIQSGHVDNRVKVEGSLEIQQFANTLNYTLNQLQIEKKALIESQLKLKESEKRFELALEGTNEGLWDWNIETNKVFYSQQWKKMIGYLPNELSDDLIEWKSRVHPEDLVQALEDLQKHISGETEIYQNTHRFLHRDGTYIWILDRGKVLRKEDGTPYRMVGAHQDISNLKKAETEKELLQNQFQQVKKLESLGQLTNGFAHEFNNLLGVILGFIELSELKISDEEKAKHYLNKSKQNIFKARDIIRKLQNFSKGGHHQAEYLEFDKTILDTVSTIKLATPHYVEITSQINITNNYIYFDRNIFDQLLLQLFQNAFESFSDELFNNSIHITARTSHSKDEFCQTCKNLESQNWIILEIKDNGMGMDSDTLSKVFDPFFSTKELGKGRGLGLPMTHGVIHRYGGHIRVESNKGHGTTVSLYFLNKTEEALKYLSKIA